MVPLGRQVSQQGSPISLRDRCRHNSCAGAGERDKEEKHFYTIGPKRQYIVLLSFFSHFVFSGYN